MGTGTPYNGHLTPQQWAPDPPIMGTPAPPVGRAGARAEAPAAPVLARAPPHGRRRRLRSGPLNSMRSPVIHRVQTLEDKMGSPVIPSATCRHSWTTCEPTSSTARSHP